MAGYLPSSGSLAMSTINSTFDGRGQNLNAYRGTAWYTAAGGSGTFSSGAISFNDFYNKGPSPAITISLGSVTANAPFEGQAPAPGEPAYATLYFNSNGTWSADLDANIGVSDNWADPTTTGVGSSYWIRFTRSYFSGGFGNTATPTTGWLQLNTTRDITVYNSGTNSIVSAQYTIEISTNSAGTNIVATASAIDVYALLFGV